MNLTYNRMAHLDHTVYFDEMRGGSRNSGFIQRMLAERPEDFELDAIGSPSMWLQMHYPLYGKEQKTSKEPETHEGILYNVNLKANGTFKSITPIADTSSLKKEEDELRKLQAKIQERVDKGELKTQAQLSDDPEHQLFRKKKDAYNKKAIDTNKKTREKLEEVWKTERDIIHAKYSIPNKKHKKEPKEIRVVEDIKEPYIGSRYTHAERVEEYNKMLENKDDEDLNVAYIGQEEPPAEAVKTIEEVVADSSEEEVGKFAYNKEFFGAIDKMYTVNKSRVSAIRGKVVPAELFDAIVSIQNNYDLYPTPHASLKPIFDDIDKLEGRYTTTLNFLEPSAGTGNIVRSMIDFGTRRKIKSIDVVEMSSDLAKLLKEQTTISNVYREDFLEFQPKRDDYHYIVMNPPYSDGSNKTFWLEHIMKAMNIAWTQIEEGGGIQCTTYAIIPKTYIEDMWRKYYPNNQGAKEKYIGSDWEIPFDMEVCRKKKALVDKYKWLEDDDFKPEFWIKKVGEIDDFAKIQPNGTARSMGLTVGIYRLYIGSRMGGSKKRR